MTTSPPPPEFPNVRLDQWLHHGMNAITEELDAVLDIDAGLRDARLPTHHRSLETALDAVLDIDAGLRALLPQGTHQSAARPTDHSDSDSTSMRAYVQRLAASPLRERLELRSRLHLDELPTIHMLAGLLVNALILARELEHTLATPACDRDLAGALDRTLARARDLALNLAQIPNFTCEFDRAHEIIHDIRRGLVDARAQVLDRALDEALDHARHRARYLISAVLGSLAVALGRVACDPESVRAFELPLDLVRLTHSPASDRNLEVARGLVEDITALDAAVTDFTTANLIHVDLRGINLQGVRWSALTTQWPPEWLFPIRIASVQIDPNRRPDLYEIRDNHRLPITTIDAGYS